MASLQWDGKNLFACRPLTRPITTCGKRSLVLLWPVRAPRWIVQHSNPHKWGESFTAELMVVTLKEQLVFWGKVRQNIPSSQHTSQRNIPWYRETNNNFLVIFLRCAAGHFCQSLAGRIHRGTKCSATTRPHEGVAVSRRSHEGHGCCVSTTFRGSKLLDRNLLEISCNWSAAPSLMQYSDVIFHLDVLSLLWEQWKLIPVPCKYMYQ